MNQAVWLWSKLCHHRAGTTEGKTTVISASGCFRSSASMYSRRGPRTERYGESRITSGTSSTNRFHWCWISLWSLPSVFTFTAITSREMEWAYSAADAAVARAGAITLAELCRFRIPALLIPYPHAKDDHQAANALALARAGAAWAVRQEGFRREILRAWGEALVSGNEILDNMREALAAFDRPGAEDFILRDLRERIAS